MPSHLNKALLNKIVSTLCFISYIYKKKKNFRRKFKTIDENLKFLTKIKSFWQKSKTFNENPELSIRIQNFRRKSKTFGKKTKLLTRIRNLYWLLLSHNLIFVPSYFFRSQINNSNNSITKTVCIYYIIIGIIDLWKHARIDIHVSYLQP